VISRWNQVAERNRVAVARNAERVLADTTYDRLRRPRPLLILALAYVATTVARPICWLAFGSIAGVVSILPCLAANAALSAVEFGDEHATITFDYESVSAVFWPLLSLLLGGPSIVLATRKRATGVD
jgi:hypothetical protein